MPPCKVRERRCSVKSATPPRRQPPITGYEQTNWS